MREDQIDQAERRATLENDRQLREAEQRRASTYHQHGLAQADELSGGRFGAIGKPHVVGSTSTSASQYPAAAAHQRDPVPDEPPLGYCIDEMPFENPAGCPVSPAAPGGAEAPSSLSPLSPDVEPAPPSSSANDERRR